MNRRIRTSVGVCLFAWWLCAPLRAQEQPQPAQEPERGPDVTEGVVWDSYLGMERPYKRLRGDALPTYTVVEMFFYDGSEELKRTPEFWNNYVEYLGIEPGSGAEAVLKDAILKARRWVLYSGPDEPPPPWSLGPPVTVEDHVERKRHQVDHLAKIYASLLLDLAAHGYEIDRLNDHLESDVRAGTSVTINPDPFSSDDLEELTLDEERKFDHRLIEALAAEGARRSAEGGR